MTAFIIISIVFYLFLGIIWSRRTFTNLIIKISMFTMSAWGFYNIITSKVSELAPNGVVLENGMRLF